MQTRSQTSLQISVTDVNDDPPVIEGAGRWIGDYNYVVGIADDVVFNTSILQIQVSRYVAIFVYIT